MSDDWSNLELSEREMRVLLSQAADRVVAHVLSLPDQPAADAQGAEGAARGLAGALPESGEPLDDLLTLLFERAVPKSFNTAGPGYLAYVPGGGLFASAVAALIAESVNRYTGVWAAAPALVQLETNVIRWLCGIVGYPPESGGILTSGGSLANFSAIVTARRERLPEDFLSGVVYASEEAHHSIRKAAMLAGLPAAGVRTVAVDSAFRIDAESLRFSIDADRKAGRRPFLIVANAGSTNTGAVDDLAGLADLAAGEGLWLHVDAAYGGFFLLTERGRSLLRGIERADSVVLDPHKGLFVPYGVGSLLVRDVEALRRAHGVPAEYLPPTQRNPDFLDFAELSPELSRDFRGLRVWLPLKLHGVATFRRALDEKLDLAREAADGLRATPGIEIVAEPSLSLTAFRLSWPEAEAADRDAVNRELLARVNAGGRVYLSGTTLPRGFVLRMCVLSFRTHRDRVAEAVAAVANAAKELAR
jgi:aromatic-L-amino-acid/L-tryptophan decarboxylase